MTGRVEDEANDLVERLEQKTNRPLRIMDEFYVPVVGSLLAILHGDRIDPTDPEIVNMFKTWQAALMDAGKLLFRIVQGNTYVMRLLDCLDMHSVGKMFRAAKGYFQPIIEEHKRTVIKDQPRDYIDKFLSEIWVSFTNKQKNKLKMRPFTGWQ